MNRAYPYLLAFSLMLGACGGSSDSTPASPTPPIAGMSPLVISASNAKPAAQAAYGSTLRSMNTGDMVSGGGLASSPSGGFQKLHLERTISNLAARAARKVPLGPEVQPCLQSGTTTISGELATGLPFSVNDTINLEAMDCDDGLGEVVNGRMEITVTAYSGDILFGPGYYLEMMVLLIDFEVATATDTILSNGDSTVTIDTTGTPLVVLSVSGISMTTESLSGTETITNFETLQTVDTSVVQAEPYTLAASGTISSTELGGEIDYATPTTFQGAGAAYPFAGEMLISGANNATIRLIALDEINVRIEIDTNGDGTVDATEDTTWADIAA